MSDAIDVYLVADAREAERTTQYNAAAKNTGRVILVDQMYKERVLLIRSLYVSVAAARSAHFEQSILELQASLSKTAGGKIRFF